MAKDKVYITLEVTDKGTKIVKSFDKNTEQAFNKMKANARASTASMSSSLQKLRQHWLAVTAAMTGVVLVAKEVITAASDLQEVNSKFNVVFADQITLAEKWAGQLVDSYAMSTRESKQFLASIQDLLVPMGMARDAAGRMSFEVVKLSADLGSFNNLPTAQVMADIQSGLVGNYETMKKYGVVLNATVVQEKALAMGLAATKDELTAAHKAHAAYILMVEGSEAAIGDMARTSEGYANQMKQLKANIEDMSAAIGIKLLPAMTNIVKSMGFLINMISEGVIAIDILNVSALKSLNFLLSGLEKFYTVLGKLPGRLGEPYRDAAETIKGFMIEIESMIKGGEEIIIEQMRKNEEFDRSLKNLGKSSTRGGITDTGTDTMKFDYELGLINAELRLFQLQSEAAWAAYRKGMQETIPDQNKFIEGIAGEQTAIMLLEKEIDEGLAQSLKSIDEKGVTIFDHLKNAVTGWASTFSSQLNDMLWTAETTFADILESFGRMITQMVIQKQVVEPMLGLDWSKIFTGAHGGVFQKGSIIPYGRGGIVERPTIFPMATGAGLMGEKGPEGVLPLTRTRSGDLGVKTQGAGTNIEINMINQSGQALEATQRGGRQESGKYIIDVVVKELQRGRALRQMIRSTI